jgi:hypothetical protein
LKTNGDILTKEKFGKYFDRLYQYFQMDAFNNLFQNITIDSLLKKDRIKYEKHLKNAGCYSFGEIHIKGELVTLLYGTNSNGRYLKNHPEEVMVCEEHS